MSIHYWFSLLLAFGSLPGELLAQNAAPDRPQALDSMELACLERAAQPLIARAQATLPDARRRFAAGLGTNWRFFVTTLLFDGTGRQEQVFVAVSALRGDSLEGYIDSDIGFVGVFRRGHRVIITPDAVRDWTITQPDGSEEGNLLGKMMDRIQERLRQTPRAKLCDVLPVE